MIKDLIKEGIKKIKEELVNMPNMPGVYRMLDKDGKVLYVGKAKDLAKRIVNYTQINRLCKRMCLAIEQIDKLEIITVNTEAQALVLEANLIKSLKPKYNILLKDDKSMPYILVRQDHPFNQILKFRGSKNIKGQYFGPFASVKTVDETIEFLEKNFLLRNCSDHFFSIRKTPCMQYQIKRCSAPCVNKIALQDYQHNVNQALTFLEGKSVTLQQEISLAMQNASENMEYEKAAKFRDQLRALNYIQNKNTNLFNIEEADVIGIVKEGDIACIQLFLFRNNQNYGNRNFFFSQVLDEPIEKILEIFLIQFYQNNPIPKLTISPILPEDYQVLTEGFPIKLLVPSHFPRHPRQAAERRDRGSQEYLQDPRSSAPLALTSGMTREVLLKVIQFAQDNAKVALSRKYEEKQHQQNLCKQVQKLFELPDSIKRIEVYDNSHIMGAHAVGAMIVATEEGFNKKQYRKYNIKITNIGNDYAMLEEVLTRRLAKLEEDNYPDLLLIDGGEGHLSTANAVMNKFNLKIPIVCISKGVERNAGKEIFHRVGKEPFTLDKYLPVMKYLQILRDEAHRFAITAHRKKRSNAMNFSTLRQIPGIGPIRRKALINHFASIEDIKNASIEQLLKLEGINKKSAEAIFQYFHSN